MIRNGRIAAALVLLTFAPPPASAELRTVKFTLAGMDCAYCNGAMNTAIKKLDGVESIELLPEKGTAEIRLKADNKITLREVRRIIKSTGYTPGDANITARGRIVISGAQPTFDLINGSTLQIVDRPKDAGDGLVEITGVSKADDKNEEHLTIKSIK
jgi:copper chaperone CopZ